MPTQIQFKRGTAASMAALNPVLTAGEPGYETDTRKVKIGDGTTAWNSLRYVTDAIVNSPTALSADQNNYVLPATADIFRFTSSTPVTITGIAAGYHGQQETLINVGSSTITLANNSASSSVGNRFVTSWSGNLVLNPGNFVRIVYDGTSAVWRVDAAPSTFDGSQIASGTVAAARLGSGTANNTTFLRGDQVYATVCDTFIFTRSSAPASASGSNGSYTWSVPATAKSITIDCTSGGGGGGSGRRGAAGTVRGGGGGGAGGGRAIYTFPLSELSDRGLTVNVGSGGAGGAAATANDTNGNAGANGGNSDVRITNDANGWLALAWRGNGGGAGTTAGGAAGIVAWSNTYASASGGAGGTGAAGGNAPLGPTQAATSGGGGGGISAGDVAFAGGETYTRAVTRNLGNTVAGGAVGANGGNGAAVVPGGDGNGGSGGGASVTAAAGAGGNGSAYGGGGGGGGASLNGFNSGAGGNGGDGVVRITVWY